MPHTVFRRRSGGDSVEQIQPDLIIPTGRRKGQSPDVADIHRALAEHEKAQAPRSDRGSAQRLRRPSPTLGEDTRRRLTKSLSALPGP
ncbi:hypothetical protein ACFTXM_09435 [Streptomyces sp. NPDC056930]|uniref:hypothetical protein n=1 Tax=Streptomyces sp. NPDC056930 TaxID=3345967 RepID=UPI00363E90B5